MVVGEFPSSSEDTRAHSLAGLRARFVAPSKRAGSVTFVGYVLDEAGRPSRLGHKVDLVRRVPRWARSEVTCIRLAVKPEPSVRLRE